MQHHPLDRQGWADARPAGNLPSRPDCETLALLRSFLLPILRDGRNWTEIARRLEDKGYGIAFREGHLVLVAEDGTAICTGSALGMPLRDIAARIGRPAIRASLDGQRGALR